jgi:hypothetical protein
MTISVVVPFAFYISAIHFLMDIIGVFYFDLPADIRASFTILRL